MSPNATLLAYTGPSNIKELRDQAALISILWREAEQNLKSARSKPHNPEIASGDILLEGDLETLTIESESSNIIVRAIQPRLLLVLVGGRPPTHVDQLFKITPETGGDARYPPADYRPPPSDITEAAEGESSRVDADLKLGLLHIQRKKVDAATEHMRADFQSKGFMMPDDSSIP
jgi:hypothetical protein